MKPRFLPFLIMCICCIRLTAQDNYEIQVYESETQAPLSTMFELHSNVTVIGFKQDQNGVVADNLAWHETVEITQGITPWFEIGTYLFLSANPGSYAPAWVGDHLRPRFRAPESWHWPVGVSLSLEAGYQRPRYCIDTWTLEIRPIIDKHYKWFYVSFNPVVDYAFVGQTHSGGPQFSPDVKLQFNVIKQFGFGVEYYGGVGPIRAPYSVNQQFQQIGPAFDIDVSEDYEINFGYMFGLTPGTERGIVKLILGRRVDWHKKKKAPVSN